MANTGYIKFNTKDIVTVIQEETTDKVNQSQIADMLTKTEASTTYLGIGAKAASATVADTANSVAGENVVGVVATATKASSASTADAVAWTGVSGKPNFATVATTGSYNDLKNKPSIPASPDAYITSSWKSGQSWYRKWSNGMIEQGGYRSTTPSANAITINFNTNFTSSNVGVFITPKSSTSSGYQIAVTEVSNSNFKAISFFSAFFWYACGY